ncbi:hypothetical protein LTR09_012488 [Extremus antarcticus]|uniref:Cell surface protein n=1 Tax=Extremus antarcticus TaxID=702011 RepID=A0AAJ0D9U6_9PEZI|nr:hypothetical protein LTR09_012488 [Extremus antarcticus]
MKLLSRIAPKRYRSHEKLQSTVVVPLYQYPLTEDTYGPLHTAISASPGQQFLVILNPDSGPGTPPWWPDPGYVREVPRLNAYPNVCTIGYVRIDYCERPIEDVLGDIRAYGGWATDRKHAGVFVRGIFFDETPNHWNQHAATYLKDISREVRKVAGIDSPRLVMHNPGTLPDSRLTTASEPDVTIVCEESLEKYRTWDPQQRILLEAWPRARCCIMLHTVPQKQISVMVEELRSRAGYVFITELGAGACYQSWGSGCEEFVVSMAGAETPSK